jgi:hypothetical protein
LGFWAGGESKDSSAQISTQAAFIAREQLTHLQRRDGHVGDHCNGSRTFVTLSYNSFVSSMNHPVPKGNQMMSLWNS